MFGLDFIRKLKPCKWRYIDPLDDGVEHFGFIAQEVEKLAPHHQYGFVKISDEGMYSIVLGEFIGPLTRALQELDARVIALEEELAELKKEKYG